MEKIHKANDKESSEEYLTDEERKQLLSALHCRLFWVGQHIPDYVEFEGKNYPLHNYVWDLIQKDTLIEVESPELINALILFRQKKKKMKRSLKKKPLLVKKQRLFIAKLRVCCAQ